ncbi:beta-L-arabinofuranosidase domain-containing protein [Mangrovibacterium sp.]|uniref:beta-L-arabinofuranosidase domain-containing protein n=1 Tax=Mangrovibacterium sp. TaxID=1961364 RepID=UPI003566B669
MKLRNLIYLFGLLPMLAVGQQKQAAEVFQLSEVRLLDSPFKKAMMTDMDYILVLDMDRLLAPYLKEAGLQPKAENYTNWENTGLDGHIGGHYLSALSKMYAATGDERMKERMDYMLAEFKRAQDACGDGYLSGVPGGKAMWQEISEGKIDAGSFSLNKKWVPLYNIHKIYAGLCDAYVFGGSDKAKEMLIKLTDWAIHLVKDLSDDQIQDMLRSEHGGLNEVFADVAAITGDEKYVKLAQQFSQKSILEPLIKHEDHLTGMHANTQIPKIIGYKRVAEVNGDESWADAARYFWENVVDKRSVSIGGNSVREHFHPIDDYSSMIESEQGPETCNTYNMLKLTKQLFLSDPEVKYMDYYERTMYNHILSTEEPDHGGFVYFTPMRPGHYRVYSQPQTSFWCCVGSGLENHTKYGELIYAHSGDDIYVNLFIPSTLNWEEKGLELTQETKFPDAESSTLTINPKKKSEFALYIRYPKWVEAGALKIQVNGGNVVVDGTPGEYVAVKRTWKKGDKVNLTFPMETTIEQLPDGQNYYSILRGPIVLAAKTDTANQDGLYADDSRGGHIAAGPKYPLSEMPVVVGDASELAEKVNPVAGKPMTFMLTGLSDKQDLVLIPFFRLHESRYILYFQVVSAADLQAMENKTAKEEAEKKALAEATIDLVFPGEQQPESDHFIQSENTNSGVNQGRHWRDATGWLSYQLNDKNRKAGKLRIMYFGLDSGRNFTISINDEKVADVTLDGSKGFEFFTVDYEIPQEIVEDADGKFRVKFEAAPGSIAGGIYEVRLMK